MSLRGVVKLNIKAIKNGLVGVFDRETIIIEAYGKDCFRFRSTKGRKIVDENWTLLDSEECDYKITIDEEFAEIVNGGISVTVSQFGEIKYRDKNDNVLLEEFWRVYFNEKEMCIPARNYKSISSDTFEADLYFLPDRKEHFFGMGQRENDLLDLKGSTMLLDQRNTQVNIPFVYSTKGYGFVWNNPAVGHTEFVTNQTRWNAKATKQIDYLIFTGDSPREISKKYSELYGKTPMLPEFAAGFWQSKLRYETQEELLEVAREYKRRDLPISVIVIDFFHWTEQGEWAFDPIYWPDPKAMVDELNEMGIKLMVSIWPTVSHELPEYYDLEEKGYLATAERGANVFFTIRGANNVYDATNPEAREFFWNRAKENYYKYGIKLFWLDEIEPETRPYDFEIIRYYLGNGQEVGNIYPYCSAQTFYDGLKEAGENDIVNLCRSAWLGSQRFGAVLWSGDIRSDFETLRLQIKAGLNVSFSGMPWWTTDIGGFHGGNIESEYFRELIVRWFQFGVFCPIFRLHGNRLPRETEDFTLTGAPNEVWSFGEKAYGIIRNIMMLREKIKPYIMEQMKLASEEGIPVMRPLFYDYWQDEESYKIEDAYLFGPDILVAPIYNEGETSREVYLPKGESWKDAKDGKVYEGGVYITYEAPLNVIPIFLREGSKIQFSNIF